MHARCAFVVAFAALAAAGAKGAFAQTVHLRLRGTAHIEAQGVRVDGDELLVRGAVTDDARVPLEGGPLLVAVAPAALPSKTLPLGGARNCATGETVEVTSEGKMRLVVDSAGRFCARVPLPLDRYVVRLSYGGSTYVEGNDARLDVDLSRRACTLTFAPEPRVLSLDARAITLDANATLETDGATGPGVGLALRLTTERPGATPLASATTDAAGHARFVLDPAALGAPGPGELRLVFAGNASAGSAEHAAHVERHAHVDLDVPDAVDGRLSSGSPEEGVSVVVVAHAVGGEVASGSVEARVNDAIVGASPIEGGSAKLLLTFALPDSIGAASEVPVVLRYVPSNPWYEPGVETTWRLPVRGRSPLRQIPLVLAGIAVAAWFAATRAQRARALATLPVRARAAPKGEAKVDVVRVARRASEGWRGRLTDADDGTTIAGARVAIERPAFGRPESLGTVLTDDDGRFVLGAIEARPGDELVIEGQLHVSLRRPLPPAGELDAQLVLRRRALLTRLVGWARQRGRPFDARPEPTPAHVRHAAGEDFQVARWADALEHAAFGVEEVDARVEAEVDRLAPPPPAVPRPQAPAADPRALAHPTKPNR